MPAQLVVQRVQLFVAQDAVVDAVDVYVVGRVGGRGAQLLGVRYGKVHPAAVHWHPASGSHLHCQAAPLLSAAIALNSINSQLQLFTFRPDV